MEDSISCPSCEPANSVQGRCCFALFDWTIISWELRKVRSHRSSQGHHSQSDLLQKQTESKALILRTHSFAVWVSAIRGRCHILVMPTQRKVHSKVVLAFTYTEQELPISLTHTNTHSASVNTSNSQNAGNNKPLRRPIQSSRNVRLFDKLHLLPEGTLAFHFSQMECNKILHVGYTRCSKRMLSVSIRWTISFFVSFCEDRTELELENEKKVQIPHFH